MSETTNSHLPEQNKGANEPLAQPVETAPEKPKKRQFILPYLMLAIFLLTLLPGPLFFVGLVLPGPMQETKTVIIPRGSSVREITQILDDNNILIHPLLFRAASRLIAKDQLKAGEYNLSPGLSVIDVADILNEGKTVRRQVTVPEGLTSYEVTNILRNTPVLTGDLTSVPEEGSLLPETYNYTYNDTRIGLIERMQKDAQTLLNTMWEKRDENLPFKTPKEALILASIVEKETGKMAEERPLVASVFINRLRLGMPLQSDPTVIYALTGGAGGLGRKLCHADLLTPSPMNTYVQQGLPPTPISNPGRAALESVLHPEKSDFLYFVADGSGGHAFAKSLDEHNKNVTKWIRLTKP
ncbi:MAG: endolytic transglycosylase MltG [Alphaproteobacteria bacterium]|nr:endolytic transglycosylase MltG [Alphaproteobacteria bacterium]